MNRSLLCNSLLGSVGVLIVATAGLAACSSNAKPPEAPPTEAPEVGSGTNDGADMTGKDPNRGNIAIGPKIQALCNLPTANFDFDSAALDPTAKGALDALADCFVQGPAKGKGMRLVGHADPRGETEYNFGLGQKRAGSVASYLKGKGLGDDRVETSSRGELDATGSDEEGWAKDRKVEIFLAE